MDGESRANPYLAGNYAPVRTEDDFVLTVQGELPENLAGTLYRNGPNPQFEPRDGGHHWFIGDGMIHAFHIDAARHPGAITYRNRWVRTPKFNAERQAGQALLGSWGNPGTTDPAMFETGGGVANTNIVHHAGRLLALEEAHAPVEMDPRTLATKGQLGQTSPGNLGGRVTAHPKFDRRTGEMIFFAYADDDMPLSRKISWGIAGADGRLTRRETFEAPYCSMIHDFMVTENYLLIPVLPLMGSIESAMSGGAPFVWAPEQPALVAVMRRDQGVASLRWFQTEACYVFHVMNAFEHNGRIIADVMKYPSAPLFPSLNGKTRPTETANLTRWEFDLAAPTGTIRETLLDDTAGEFPRIDDRFDGAAYRHGWFAAQRTPRQTIHADSIAHIDTVTGRRQILEMPHGDAISEPVFVPASPDAPEGQGSILAVAYRAREAVSELLVLDALDISRGPIASAMLPRRVPFGFHGNWMSDTGSR
jgi:carotenoid cleavage dioxygenase